MSIMGFATAVFLFCLGLFTVLTRRNAFKTVIGLMLMESGVLLLLVSWAYIPGGGPPILPLQGTGVDPLPHALTLTAIVIGACDIALAFAFIMKLERFEKSVDVDRFRWLRG
ncbi:MAG: cation:proton antiporter [Synergistales bacterium]|nr:cation:proton antiporter [Synergistales bacterium]